MNNSVFGKTMVNLRKRESLVHHQKRLSKLSAKPGFKSFKIFNEDLASVELTKSKLVLNRPIYMYVGFSILELSKVLMYECHYNYIKKSMVSVQLSVSQIRTLNVTIYLPRMCMST